MAETKNQSQGTAETPARTYTFRATGGLVAAKAAKPDRDATPTYNFVGGSVRIRREVSERLFGATGGRFDFLANPAASRIVLWPTAAGSGLAVRNACDAGRGETKATDNAARSWHSFPIASTLAGANWPPLWVVPKGTDCLPLVGSVVPSASILDENGDPAIPGYVGEVVVLECLDPKGRHPLAV